MPHVWIEEHQVELLKRAVGKWSSAVDENEIWSASDEECAKEALMILGISLNDLYTLLDSVDEDTN